ncbi:MAG: carboxypeptidase regulatory-like domain-containing protein [Planctomycetes bacterium]|nr:carboxypeptidase regulatory-like domain-containing protein [Planctomycetota bacterium]
MPLLRRPTRPRLLLVAALAAAAAGCDSGSKLCPVSGTITYKGQPLDSGSVTFLFINPPGPAGGALVTNGKFKIAAPNGLEPGTYRVQISSPKGPGERTPEQIAAGASTPAKERIPPNYNTQSTLTVEVTRSGPNEFNWSID